MNAEHKTILRRPENYPTQSDVEIFLIELIPIFLYVLILLKAISYITPIKKKKEERE